MKEERIAVLAGNKHEYRNFIEREAKENVFYIYIDSPMRVMGNRFTGSIVYGTFWSRKDSVELSDLVKRNTLSHSPLS